MIIYLRNFPSLRPRPEPTTIPPDDMDDISSMGLPYALLLNFFKTRPTPMFDNLPPTRRWYSSVSTTGFCDLALRTSVLDKIP